MSTLLATNAYVLVQALSALFWDILNLLNPELIEVP
jgi:hypothetical protein